MASLCFYIRLFAILTYTNGVCDAMPVLRTIELSDGKECVRMKDSMTCEWQGTGSYTIRKGDSKGLASVTFDRLQSSILNAHDLPELRQLSYGFSDFDRITTPCEHIVNNERDVRVISGTKSGTGKPSTSNCVSI